MGWSFSPADSRLCISAWVVPDSLAPSPNVIDPLICLVRFRMIKTYVNRFWNFRVNVLAASPLIVGERRAKLYASAGIRLQGTSVRPACWFFSNNISFGPSGMVNRGCQFENREEISVGSAVYFGPEVFVGTSSHLVGSQEQRAGAYSPGPVSIGNGCWIGARAMILPGVSIAPGCVIAAGAVVTSDTEPNGLYAGVPARRKKDL